MHRRLDRAGAAGSAPAPSAARPVATPASSLLALQRLAGNQAVVALLQRASTTAEKPAPGGPPSDLETKKTEWRQSFAVQRQQLGTVTVVEDPDQLTAALLSWPAHKEGPDYAEAEQLRNALTHSTDPDDEKLYQDLANLVEQQDRQEIITMNLGALSGRFLGVIGGRLEALCNWDVLPSFVPPIQDPEQEPTSAFSQWWGADWTACLHIEDIATAPWNVGWQPGDSPVKGAGRALMDAMVDKARALGCQGIGLSALPSSKGFYDTYGFTVGPRGGMTLPV